MQFHPFARRLLALVLTAAFMTTAALSGFAVYAMPIQAAYPQESIYLFDADTGEALCLCGGDKVDYDFTGFCCLSDKQMPQIAFVCCSVGIWDIIFRKIIKCYL